MSNREQPASAPCDTGTSGVNHILGRGFPPKALYLIQGLEDDSAAAIPLAGAREGKSCLYVTFSETYEELIKVARSHGWSLDGIGMLPSNLLAKADT